MFEDGRMLVGWRGLHRVTPTRKLQTLMRNIGLTVTWMHPSRKGQATYQGNR